MKTKKADKVKTTKKENGTKTEKQPKRETIAKIEAAIYAEPKPRRRELHIDREKLIMERGVTGTKMFFTMLPDGRELEIKTNKEDLIDVMDSMLWPLKDLKELLGQGESLGPIYYLLSNMLETLELKFDTICGMIEEESGGIKVYECNDTVPRVPKGTLLGILTGTLNAEREKEAKRNADNLIAERDEWKKKFQEAEKQRLFVSRKLSYYVSEESEGRLHIDPIAKGANLRKVEDTGKKDGGRVKCTT